MDPNQTSPTGTAILVADTDSTQAYVFESNKLPEIRGASRWLDDLNTQIGRMVETEGGERIYAGGGSLLSLVPGGKAKTLMERIETLYPQATGSATITAAWRPLPPDYDRLPFGQLVSWAGHWLRRRKESKEAPPFYETLPHQVRCQSCQKRPVDVASLSSQIEWQRCTVCKAKHDYPGGNAWFGLFETAIKGELDLLRDYFGDRTLTIRDPQSISEISQVTRGKEGYVAFIYMDGDGIGKVLESRESKEAYGRLSNTLRDVTTDAVYKALARHLRPTAVDPSELRPESSAGRANGKITIHPFEIITIGGDDVLLIVPAHVAIPIALEIGQRFSEHISDLVGEPVSMSAGVLMADDHTPIRMMRDLATQLLKEAKKRDGGGLDFHVLKSADMLDREVGKLREHHPYLIASYGDKGGGGLRLLGRPYSYSQVDSLWQGLQALKKAGFATSQMQLLAESLLDGRASSTLFYQYQRQRDRSKAYDELEKLLENVQRTETKDPLPWQAVNGQPYSHQTALWDLAELYDFVSKETT